MTNLLHGLNFIVTIAIGVSILRRDYHVAAVVFAGAVFMYLLLIFITLNK